MKSSFLLTNTELMQHADEHLQYKVMFFLVMTRPILSCSQTKASAAAFSVCAVLFALSGCTASVPAVNCT